MFKQPLRTFEELTFARVPPSEPYPQSMRSLSSGAITMPPMLGEYVSPTEPRGR